MSAVLEAKNLAKWYGAVIAINDVSFEVPQGITALLGPNGAGKSTLLAMFTGLMRPTRGSVTVLGQKVWDNPEINTRLGLCHQYDSFYEDMTGVEFVTLMAKFQGVPRRAAREHARGCLRRVALVEASWNRPIRGYSKGMRQRVKLAQALLHDPDVLFLDEPMTGLDPEGRHDISEVIRDFARTGRTVLVSTHILHEVEALTDQILLLSQGRVLAEGDVHHIRESLETHPYSIKIACDRPRALAEILVKAAHISDLNVVEGLQPHLLVQTRRADLVFAELPSLCLEHGFSIREIVSPDDNLEAVFDYLVK